mmetsp:Transcript_93339/g.302009  ORF Transcript_93339/g.302009 Transcript_93339/m.302009 type:complete len:201 (-) Transcript_93339:22-624(-)
MRSFPCRPGRSTAYAAATTTTPRRATAPPRLLRGGRSRRRRSRAGPPVSPLPSTRSSERPRAGCSADCRLPVVAGSSSDLDPVAVPRARDLRRTVHREGAPDHRALLRRPGRAHWEGGGSAKVASDPLLALQAQGAGPAKTSRTMLEIHCLQVNSYFASLGQKPSAPPEHSAPRRRAQKVARRRHFYTSCKGARGRCGHC